MRILFIGDIFGQPGRTAVKHWLKNYRDEQAIDFVIANCENAAGGKGITPAVGEELFGSGIDVLTGGNHSFQQREGMDYHDKEARLLRPANFPPGTPGHGLGIYQDSAGHNVAVLNLQGRAFMKPIDCPFRAADSLVAEALARTRILIVDFHGEATSEKIAMAAYLDGRASAVIGTHTHVATADARVTAAGTAAITDVGMSGPYDSVIGIETQVVFDQLIKGLPVRHHVAKGDVRICAFEVELDHETGRARTARLVQQPGWRTGV